MLESWHQQPNETKKAYDAFKLYLGTEAEPGLRRLEDVARELSKSQQLISRWSSRHRWLERCRDFDNHCKVREEEQIGDIVAKWRKRRLEDAERAYKTQQMIQRKIEEMALWPIVEVKDEIETDDDGNTIRVTKIIPARWRVRDMAAMLVLSMKAMDNAYAIVAGAQASDKPISEDDIAASEDASIGLAAALEAIGRRRKGLPGVKGNGKH